MDSENSNIISLVDRNVGERLKACRRKHGLSVAELALELDMDAEELEEIERGFSPLDSVQLFIVCRLLSLEPDYFFEGIASTTIAPVQARG